MYTWFLKDLFLGIKKNFIFPYFGFSQVLFVLEYIFLLWENTIFNRNTVGNLQKEKKKNL